MKTKKQNHWEVWDYGLAEAADKLHRETCKGCGLPAWHAFTEDATVIYELDKHKCNSCAFLEQEKDKKSDKDKKEFGTTEMVKAVHSDTQLVVPVHDTPLPGRADWLADMLAKHNK